MTCFNNVSASSFGYLDMCQSSSWHRDILSTIHANGPQAILSGFCEPGIHLAFNYTAVQAHLTPTIRNSTDYVTKPLTPL